MEQRERDSLVFDDRAGSEWRSSLASGWPVLAVMAIGALLVLGNLVGLLTGSHMDTFGSSGGNGLAGAQLVGLLLGLGLFLVHGSARGLPRGAARRRGYSRDPPTPARDTRIRLTSRNQRRRLARRSLPGQTSALPERQ
jgi:hypothetical protein